MKKYRFESIQKNSFVTIHQSFNVPAENSRQALMYGIVHMIQDKTAISITTKCKPLSEDVTVDHEQVKRLNIRKHSLSREIRYSRGRRIHKMGSPNE